MDYTPKGICAQNIHFEITDGVVTDVEFTKGCDGNGKGIGALVSGMKVEDVIKRLEGLDCKGRGTSCPDQLATALKQYMEEN